MTLSVGGFLANQCHNMPSLPSLMRRGAIWLMKVSDAKSSDEVSIPVLFIYEATCVAGLSLFLETVEPAGLILSDKVARMKMHRRAALKSAAPRAA